MTTYQRTCQTCGNGVSHQRQTVTEDAYCTGYRDGQGDAWAELPYRPPPPAQRGTDLRWGTLYQEGYAQGYAQGAGLDVADLQPEERRPVVLNALLHSGTVLGGKTADGEPI